MYAQKIADIIADVRADPTQVGKELAYLPLVIQERLFKLTLSYIRELSMQHDNSSFVNGNMDISRLAWDIHESIYSLDLTDVI